MSRPNKSDVVFWAGVTICALALCCYALFGCAKAAQSAQSLAAAAPLVDDSAEMQADEQSAHADEKAHQLVLDRVRAAVLVKVDEAAANASESEPEAEQAAEYAPEVYEYQEVYYGGYSGGSTATTLSDLLNGQGRAYDEGGTSYTYYNHDLGWGRSTSPARTSTPTACPTTGTATSSPPPTATRGARSSTPPTARPRSTTRAAATATSTFTRTSKELTC